MYRTTLDRLDFKVSMLYLKGYSCLGNSWNPKEIFILLSNKTADCLRLQKKNPLGLHLRSSNSKKMI